jgi:hypothetical protein
MLYIVVLTYMRGSTFIRKTASSLTSTIMPTPLDLFVSSNNSSDSVKAYATKDISYTVLQVHTRPVCQPGIV